MGQDKGYAGKDHRLSVEWANGQQAKEKQDIAHVHKALGAVSERSTDTFQAELDGVSEDRVNYMETLHFLAMHRTSLQAISEHFEFMRKKRDQNCKVCAPYSISIHVRFCGYADIIRVHERVCHWRTKKRLEVHVFL